MDEYVLLLDLILEDLNRDTLDRSKLIGAPLCGVLVKLPVQDDVLEGLR